MDGWMLLFQAKGSIGSLLRLLECWTVCQEKQKRRTRIQSHATNEHVLLIYIYLMQHMKPNGGHVKAGRGKHEATSQTGKDMKGM